jgi:hypothetical protein
MFPIIYLLIKMQNPFFKLFFQIYNFFPFVVRKIIVKHAKILVQHIFY